MDYVTLSGKSIDTDRALAEAERHVLMKLVLWETLGLSDAAFARRRDEALSKGWNQGGQVSESPNLKLINDDLAQRLIIRRGAPGPGWLRPREWTESYGGGGIKRVRDDGGAQRLEVLDAADVKRGEIDLAGTDADRALEEVSQGRGVIAEQVRTLGLELRK